MTSPSPCAEDEGSERLLPDLLLAAAFGRRVGVGAVDSPAQVAAGSELGGYRILHRLGSGGMGTVYVAEQKSPRRRVALKLLAPTGTSGAMVRRFQQEAELLGSLQHSGIAQIYEAGTVELDGLGVSLHYLALELVEGLPFDEWVRERDLDLPARLELLARVCDAVEHAHQRGVVHRDLKPANVLVTDDCLDGPGQPKVLDFGVARALLPEEADAARTRVTLEGQLVGTLTYMSPEQAAGDSAATDARSDVYSLGVILYRLLCGAPPVEVSGLPLGEATRRIREQAPARPSQRARGLPAELDTIALAALAKSREERYGSSAELAGDLRRYLRGEPLLAREHSALYLLSKLLRRHRLLVGAAFSIVLLSLAFALIFGVQARRNSLLAETVGVARDELTRELRRSNLDRGRLFATAGHLRVAEDLLWGELARAPHPDDVLWGLRDLYRRFPCLGTYPLSDGSTYDLLALPDGRMVSAGADGRLREHRPPDFVPRETGFARSPGMQRLRSAPDRSRLVLLDSTRILVVLDAISLGLMFNLPLPEGEPSAFEGNALALLDDEHALVGLDDGRVLAVELRPGGVLRELASVGAPVRDLELSPSGQDLALGLADGSVLLLDLARATVRWSFAATGHEMRRMVFDPSGERLYAGGVDRRVRVLSCSDGSLLEEWSAPNGTIRQLDLDFERGRALVGGWWSLDEWSLASTERRVRLRHPTECFRLAADGEVLVTVGGGMLRTWEARVLEDPRPLFQAAGRSASIYLGQRDQAVVADGDGRLTLIDIASGTPRWSVPVLDRRIRALTVGGGGAWVVVAGEEGEAARVNARDGRVLERFGPVRAMTRASLALHPDGRRLAYAESARQVVVRDVEGGATLVRWGDLEAISGIAWSPDGQILALIDRSRGLFLFDAEGRELERREQHDSLWALCFAPDGRTIAASTWAGEVLTFDGRTLEPGPVLAGHSGTAWDLCFRGSDSRHLFSASGDGTARLWDLSEGRSLLVLDDLQGLEVLSVDVTRDGRHALLTNSVGAVHAIDLFAADRCISGNLAHQARRLDSAGLLHEGEQSLIERVHASLSGSATRE